MLRRPRRDHPASRVLCRSSRREGRSGAVLARTRETLGDGSEVCGKAAVFVSGTASERNRKKDQRRERGGAESAGLTADQRFPITSFGGNMNFIGKLLQGISFIPAIVTGIEGLFGAKAGA